MTIDVTETATCVLVKPNPYDPAKGPLTFFGDGIVPGETTIRIYTLSGEEIAVCHSEPFGVILSETKNLTQDRLREESQIVWLGKDENGKTITPGIYIYTYESSKERGVGKFTVVK